MVSNLPATDNLGTVLLSGFLFLYLVCLIKNTTGCPAELIVHKDMVCTLFIVSSLDFSDVVHEC